MNERGRELFFEFSELPSEQRREALRRVASEDRSLSAELESLLIARDRSDDFLDRRPEFHLGDSPVPEPEIPGYEVLSREGDGGFGVVFRARQNEPVERDVAIKVLRPERLGESGTARFESEQRFLARLNHPHIATIHDAGRTDDGVPYTILEWIDGAPITVFCDRHRLSIRERIRLLLLVCSGIEFAHRHGVIHGDLKPTNLLVTSDGERAIPKVIDFGLARSLERGDSGSSARVERLRSMGGTPSYMAPEQATAHGLAVDMRMDVYGLGVLLAELIGGGPALRFEAGASVSRILHSVRRAEPIEPSKQFERLGDFGRRRLASRRAVTPAALERCLRGDLDAIVRKASAHDAEDRYQSVADLVRDLQRWLDRRPVEARPASIGRTVVGFVRRHPRECAVALLISTGVAFGVGLLEESGRRTQTAERQRDAAAAEALDQARISQQTSEFLASVLTAPRPERFGADVRIAELLEDADARLDTRFADEHRVRGRIALLIGSTLSELGRFEEAVRSLSRAREAFERAGRPMETREALRELGKAALGADRADLALEVAALLAEAGPALDAEARGQELLVRARIALAFGDASTALELLESAPDQEQESIAFLRVQALSALDRRSEAESLLEQMLEEVGSAIDEITADDARTAAYVAQAELERGRSDAALALLYRVEDWQAERLPLLHSDRTLTRFTRAFCLWHRGQQDDAVKLTEVIVADHKRELAPGHPTSIRTLRFAARWLLSVGLRERSHELYQAVLDGAAHDERFDGESHAFVRAMVVCTAESPRVEEIEEAATLIDSVVNLTDRDRRIVDQSLSTAYWRAGARDRSIERTQALAERVGASGGVDSPEFFRARNVLAERVYARDGIEAAGEIVEETHRRIASVAVAEHPQRRSAEFAWLAYLHQAGRLEERARAKAAYARDLAERADAPDGDRATLLASAAWMLSTAPVQAQDLEAAQQIAELPFEGGGRHGPRSGSSSASRCVAASGCGPSSSWTRCCRSFRLIRRRSAS